MKITTVAASVLFLVGFSAGAQSVDDSPTLRSMQGAIKEQQAGSQGPQVSLVREAAIKEAALALGGQAGRLDRINEIRKQVSRLEDKLDARFNFGRLILGPGFLPPVFTRATDLLAVGPNSIRIGQESYVMERGAVPAPQNPTWRQWLYVGLEVMPMPSVNYARAGLPRNAQEKALFDSEMKSAYDFAYAAAGSTFERNLAQLEKEYVGMENYFELYARRMVTAPQIKSSHRIVAKEGERVMYVGDTYFVITEDTKFRDDYTSWRPLGR